MRKQQCRDKLWCLLSAPPPLHHPHQEWEDSFMHLLITLQLAGPALREQGPRQIFQNHPCLGTDLQFPITAPWCFPVPLSPGTGPGLSSTKRRYRAPFSVQCSLCSISKSQLMASASVLLGPDITFTIFSLVCMASLNKGLNLVLSCFSPPALNSFSFFHFSSLSHRFHYCLCLCTILVLFSPLVPFVHCTSAWAHSHLLHQRVSAWLRVLVEKFPFFCAWTGMLIQGCSWHVKELMALKLPSPCSM